MKKDIEIIAGEYITLEGDGDYDKASQLIATKGIVSPILQKIWIVSPRQEYPKIFISSKGFRHSACKAVCKVTPFVAENLLSL